MEWFFAGWVLINLLIAAGLCVASVKPQEGVWKA
ncbi:hypothetical protein PHLH3_08240 [Pseudomonas sp. St386]|nr:hypothetical protein PHLH3_08240 [Pseudomonas sp. St386]